MRTADMIAQQTEARTSEQAPIRQKSELMGPEKCRHLLTFCGHEPRGLKNDNE